MAQNVQSIWQTDFSGGVIDSVPADQLAENQCPSIVNLLPRYDGKNLTVRGGFVATEALLPVTSDNILGVMTKRLTDGQEVLVYAVAEGLVGSKTIEIYIVRDYGSVYDVEKCTATAISSGGSRTFADNVSGVWFSGWDSNRIFLSDHYSGLYTMDINPSDPGSSSVVKVLNTNGTGQLVNMAAHYGKGLVQHRGRLWLFSGNTVYFCGTDDTDASARWTNWYPYNGTDPSETVIDDGSSMMIPPYSTNVTGLASDYNGLIVFKEDSISMWTYPDSAAPWEVAEGAAIETIDYGVGCYDPAAIVQDGGDTYFLGVNTLDELGLYRLSGTSVECLSTDIQGRMANIKATGKARIALLGDTIYVFADRADIVCYSMTNDSWYDIRVPNPYFVSPSTMTEKLFLVGGDGTVYSYPTGTADNNGTTELPIPYSIETPYMKPKGWYGEFKGRMVWCEFGSKGTGQINYYLKWDSASVTDPDGQFDTPPTVSRFYNDGATYNSGYLYGGSSGIPRVMKAVIGGRGRSLAVGFSGTAITETYINRVGFGYHGRTGKT